VVPGITIRGFYAMAVLAGFINRFFALPGKLSGAFDWGLAGGLVKALDMIGNVSFFIVISIFAIWVIGTFVINFKKLKGEEA
ncbi:MAG: sulfite exporter TauE/SafE family protein, partial [Desulfobacteraceae bacterium]|nr:sulfite exporter TauE/SafE family protein [Desulfobacteraceae bacterium]